MSARRSLHGLNRSEWMQRRSEFVRRGVELPQHRLTPDNVRAIRANPHGWTARQWARELGVHVRTIEKVQMYASWRHVA